MALGVNTRLQTMNSSVGKKVESILFCDIWRFPMWGLHKVCLELWGGKEGHDFAVGWFVGWLVLLTLFQQGDQGHVCSDKLTRCYTRWKLHRADQSPGVC